MFVGNLIKARAFLTSKVPVRSVSNHSAQEFQDVLYEQDVGTRKVIFNRPQVLNALSLPMIRSLTPKLQKFDKNPTVNVIMFEGAGDKAFCAGGDIRSLYENGKDESKRHLVGKLERAFVQSQLCVGSGLFP